MSWHVAHPWQLLRVELSHSSTLAHHVPLPSYPALHAQLQLPYSFEHVPAAWQSSSSSVHSLTSAQ